MVLQELNLIFNATVLVLVIWLFRLEKPKIRKEPIWILVLIALLLRLFIPNVLVSNDEAMHAMNIQTLSEGKLDFAGTKNGVSPWNPGFYIIAAPIAKLIGSGWIAGRLVNLALSSLSVYVIYLIGLRKNKFTGWAGAILLTILPVHIYFSNTSALEISSVFFFLISYLFLLKKDKNALLALSFFTLIRPESYLISASMFFLFFKETRKYSKYQKVLFFAVIVLCGLNSYSYGILDSKWNSRLINPLVSLGDHLLSNMQFLLSPGTSLTFASLIALYTFRKEKKIGVLFLLSFLIFSLYSNFMIFDGPSRYASFPSLFLVMSASKFFDNKKKQILLIPVILMWPLVHEFMTFTSPKEEIRVTLEDEPILNSNYLPIYSNVKSISELVFPERTLHYSSSMNPLENAGYDNCGEFGEFPRNFFIVKSTNIDERLHFDYFSQCEFIQSWNKTLTKGIIEFHEVACNCEQP